jgi:hypothetical protein
VKLGALLLVVCGAAGACHDARYYVITVDGIPTDANTLRVTSETGAEQGFPLQGRPTESFSVEVSRSRPSTTITVQAMHGQCPVAQSAPTAVSGDATIHLTLLPGGCALADAGVPDAVVADAAAPPPPPDLYRPLNGAAMMNRLPRFSWSNVGSATRYEIDVEGCLTWPCSFGVVPAPSTSDTSWTPSAPLAVSATAPVGKRYIWRVRSCADVGCGAWSMTRYLDVGRRHDDMNGDGYADLAIKEPGGIIIFLGGPSGVARLISNLSLPSGPAAWGDFDGDGYGDLLVGNVSSSQVYIFYGGMLDFRAMDVLTGTDATFGAAVAAGDVDGDGLDDAIVGITGKNVSVYGAASHLLFTRAPTGLVPATFGAVVGAADLDGDGLDDVIAAAPGEDDTVQGSGEMFAFASSTGSYQALHPQGVPVNAAAGTSFIIYPDHLDDTQSLMIAGAPGGGGETLIAGFTSGTALAGDADLTFLSPDPDSIATSLFGISIASGDLNGDGSPDQAVGAPGDGNGLVVTSVGSVSVACYDGGSGRCAGSSFGQSLAIKPLDADLDDDVAVCAPAYNGSGAAIVYFSTLSTPQIVTQGVGFCEGIW